ncbi:MAG: RagB/SusD family nutrient uptake outer membrane protein [Chitinophagaceae bacterium]
MKHTHNTFLTGIALAALLLLGSCKKALDKPQPNQFVSDNAVFASEGGVRAYFYGIYRNLRSQWTNIDATAGGATDTWGYNSVNMARLNKGIDIINPGGWYVNDYRHGNREPNFRRVLFTWGFFYEAINQSNVIIDGVGRSTLADATKKKLTAEARALRAWMYFELIREFSLPILKDANSPGIPLYTTPTSISNKGKGRGTVGQVYTQINEDIAYAVANLGTDREIKSQITLNVALGMQARIMLEQGKWTEAAAAALAARNGFSLSPAEYANGYSNLDSKEVIWGFPQTQENGGQSLYYGTPSSFFEKTGNGYDNFFINSDLVAAFTNTDIRNTFYITSATPTSQQRYSTNKFGSVSASNVTLISGKVVKLNETDFDEDLPMMRVAEMILIEAEARAELNQTTQSKALLLSLQQNRDPSKTESANTGAALIAEILLERRKELYGEMGVDFLDIKRRQLALIRAGNHATAYRFSWLPNDARLLLKIPQKEFDTNTALTAADQNP